MLGLLVTVIFAIYRMGASALMKADAESELLQGLQNATRRFARDAEQTVYDSVTVAPDGQAVSFLSAVYGTGYAVDGNGRPQWQRFVVYYYEPPSGRFLRREVELVAPLPVAETIEVTGLTLSDYTNSGALLARHVHDCEFRVDLQPPTGTPILSLALGARKARYGREDEELVRLGTAVRMRN